jgi:hypothetical protein
MLDRFVWMTATLGLVYVLQSSKPLLVLRALIWWTAGKLFKDRGRQAVVWLYCPRCASPWIGALLGWLVLHHTGFDLVLDGLVALGVTSMLVTAHVFATVTDPWIDSYIQDGQETETPESAATDTDSA